MSSLAFEALLIILLIIANGVFSMSELAIVSARKVRLEQWAKEGNAKARAALRLIASPNNFLSTVQIGITLIGILSGALGGATVAKTLQKSLDTVPLVQPYSETLSFAVVVGIITYLSLVVGELVPKRLAMSNAEQIACAVAPPMRFFANIGTPVVYLLSISTEALLGLLGIQATEESQVTEEEIKAIISEGTEQGTIDEAEQEIIERVFHLGDRNITSLMTHRNDIIWFNLEDNEAMIKSKIVENPHSFYPICDGNLDELKGVVSIKDLYVGNDFTLFRDLMKPALFVPENNTAYQILEKFKEQKKHCCFIVDEYGSVQGMITLNDILEAIVGDVNETGTDEYNIHKRDDGSYLIDAQIPFYDFLDYFEKTEWMHEGEQEFDTLGGLILHNLERIPHVTDKLAWKGFEFEIMDMDGHRIDKILARTKENYSSSS